MTDHTEDRDDDGDREEGVGDQEGLVEDLHHFAADLGVCNDEGVVFRAEDRFELLARGVAGDRILEERFTMPHLRMRAANAPALRLSSA